MSSDKLDIDNLKFEHCEDEPIHIPESIQGYGYLFAMDRSNNGRVRILSKNVLDLLNLKEEEILKGDFYEFLDGPEYQDFIRETFKRAIDQNARLPLRLKFRRELVREKHAEDFYAVVYHTGDKVVLELEPAAEFRETYSALHYIKLYAMSIAPKFKRNEPLINMAQEIVDTIKYVTGMDRVVLYRFNDDDSGKVIAEAKEDFMDSYLNLYYPANDIPAQARALYTKNWVRLIPDVELESSPLIPSVDSGREPLDMTYSIIRTLSPIHRQYIRNQGIKASLSLSLVTHEHLWGIISCHSREARYIPQNVRLECENLSQLFSWHLYAKEEELYLAKKEKTDAALNAMLDKTSSSNSIVTVFKENEEKVLDMLNADGFAFFYEEDSFKLGVTPDRESMERLASKGIDEGRDYFYTTDITDIVSDDSDLNDIRGAMVIQVAKQKRYYTAWFRKEHRYTQRWAGVPKEEEVMASKKERLMPRSSFEVHEKEIHNQSREWDENDINIATRFNKVFMAYALEKQATMRKDINSLQQQDQYKNEFMATLAHELKNPLTPIRTGISILEHSADEEARARILKVMRRQTTTITKMIDDLLDVSRISEGKVTLEKQKTHLQEILTQAIEVCDEAIREKEHNLIMDLPESPVYLHADPLRLSQIFINILNNATKYTPKGGRITIDMERESQQVSVTIADNGLGIPQDKLDDIFDMFTQMETHAGSSQGGLGIGLTLVKKLVSLHDGEIKVRSDGPGDGSEFEIILPVGDLSNSR
ncbi:ATP-binding protein [Roseivirga sp. BDSF3-8]|uniref:ATP-binding protein n=1 Tax=Roseivirga sp. BDSF3-8 TaxID=3241598 RepID=UPI003531A3A8